MALVLNNNAGYITSQPDFDAVQVNEKWVPPGVTKRLIRGMKAANGGDISQLGAERLSLDYRLQLFVPTSSVAYFQPDAFDLDLDGVIAARVTVTLEPITPWDEDVIEQVQEGLVPNEDLSEDAITAIVQAELLRVADEVKVHAQVIASFVNNGAEGNNSLRGVILSVADDLADADTRTVVAGATNELVPAITPTDIIGLELEHLITIAESAGRERPELLFAISLLTGVAYAKISERFAAAFEPFSTAVERARVDRVTNVSEDLVDNAINYDGILELAKEAGSLRNIVRIEVVRASKLTLDHLNDLTDQDFTDAELTALADRAAGTPDVGELASATRKLGLAKAAEGSDWIAHVNGGNDDDADSNMYQNAGIWEPFAIPVAESDYLLAVGKYALAAPTTRVIKVQNTSGEALADFATARMNTINHELYGQCTEVKSYRGAIWGALSLPKSVMLFDEASADIVGQVQHSTAHISYMKSGHHATANNLGHTLSKLLDAIDQTYETADIPERLAFGTYYGTKPADQRAVALMLRYKYAQNELSFAIGRRITPQGPGTVSMYLLNMVIEQLHQVNFFKFMEREDAYTQFKGMYTIYAKTSYLEVPYASFFYGRSKSESVDLKQSVGPMYAYAAAIGAAMPQSTIGDSVALKREAMAASSNSITARLEVESFVRAYRTFLRTLIRNRMTKQAGLKGATATIEDAED